MFTKGGIRDRLPNKKRRLKLPLCWRWLSRQSRIMYSSDGQPTASFVSCRFWMNYAEKIFKTMPSVFSGSRWPGFFQPFYCVNERFLQWTRSIAEILCCRFAGKKCIALEHMDGIRREKQFFLSSDAVNLIERRDDFRQRDREVRHGFIYTRTAPDSWTSW